MTKIFINPGHCPGKDSGAIGRGVYSDLQECNITSKIGKRVTAYLQSAGCEIKFLQVDGLKNISDAANDWNADYFVSIHCNSYNTVANGTETYCYSFSSTAHNLAKAVHARITKSFPQLIDRGVKTAAFSVLRNTAMPAILVETAFIDNAHDAKLLVEREDDFARAIACGITDFLQIAKPDVIDTPVKNICPVCGRYLN